jgi:protein O-GlcNAc transferase
MPSYDNVLFVSNYSDRCDAQSLIDLHKGWGAHLTAITRGTVAKRSLSQGGRLKIGFISPDFNQHSVAYFFEPILQHLDRERFQPYCYYSNRRIDTTTKRFSEYVEWWRPVAGLRDEAVVKQIEDDGIDILMDLAGHTSDNRLAVFARRPAPLQVTYLGYPTTTGMSEMQFRLSDWVVDPIGDEYLSSEKLLRLPHSYFCYRPPETSLDVEGCPALHERCITFGSFNNMAKASAATFRLWARVLKAVPRSRLRLKSLALANDIVREKVIATFCQNGIDDSRITLLPWQSDTDTHLAQYHGIDIALDTTPYNGATTTCEALWMGVPVVSLRGGTHASRMGASILSAAGMPELIASSEDEFVQHCADLAGDVNALAARRFGSRDRLIESPLMQQETFVRDFEVVMEHAVRSTV